MTTKRRMILTGQLLVPAGIVAAVLMPVLSIAYGIGQYVTRVDRLDATDSSVIDVLNTHDERLLGIEKHTAAIDAKLSLLIDLMKGRNRDENRDR